MKAITTRIAIAGAAGRMGQALIAAVQADARFTLSALGERTEHLASLAHPTALMTADAAHLAEHADAVIDFTTPAATLAIAEAVANKGGVHIIGTTGFSESEQAKLVSYAQRARIVQSGNFSLGVNVMTMLVEQAAKALSDAYDIEIHELHHRHKKDAPSGTALMLGRAAAKGRSVALQPVLDRRGERKRGEIGFSVSRGGDVVGVHDVMFAGPGETLTLSHQGFDRSIYAAGALTAAYWAQSQKPGLYSMRDVLESR